MVLTPRSEQPGRTRSSGTVAVVTLSGFSQFPTETRQSNSLLGPSARWAHTQTKNVQVIHAFPPITLFYVLLAVCYGKPHISQLRVLKVRQSHRY